MKKILITGGSGFIGTNLVDFYVSQGDKVLNIDFISPKKQSHNQFWINADICNLYSLLEVVKRFQPEYIFHLAARTDLKETKNIKGYSANVEGVNNIIKAIKTCKTVKRSIFASSRMVCRKSYQPKDEFDTCPTNLYGESKVIGEKIVRDSQLENVWLIVRPTSIWGPWFDVPYRDFFLAIARGRYFHPSSLDIYKSFGFIMNTVYELDKLLHAAEEKVHGRTFYLADYPPINVREMANCIQKTMVVKKITNIPLTILHLFSLCGDLLKLLGWQNPLLTSFRLDNILTQMVYDCDPLKEIVGELPFTMEQGIQITVNWLHENGQI